MNSVRGIARNTSLLVAARILGAAINVVSFVALARYLGSGSFGVLSFAMAFALIFSVFVDVGLEQLTIRNVAREKPLARKYLGNIALIKIILAIATFGLVAITVYLMGYPQRVLLVVYLVAGSYILNSFTSTFNAIFQAYERMEFVSLQLILQNLLMLGGILLGIAWGFGVVYFALVYVLSSAVAMGFSLTICLWRFVVPKLESDWTFWKTILKQALPFGLSMICIASYTWISSVILSRMQTDEAVAWYNAAYRLTTSLYLIPLSFFAAIYPVMSRFHSSSPSTMTFVFQRSFKYMLILAIPIAVGTTLLADSLISTIFGSGYGPSANVLQILIWANIFTFGLQPLWYLLCSIDKQIECAKAVILGAVVNVILNLLLIHWFSYRGAAIVEIVTEVTIMTSLWVSVRKLGYGLDGKLPALTLKLAGASLVMAVAVTYSKGFGLFPALATGVFTYSGAMLVIRAIDLEDKRLLMQIVKKTEVQPQ